MTGLLNKFVSSVYFAGGVPRFPEAVPIIRYQIRSHTLEDDFFLW